MKRILGAVGWAAALCVVVPVGCVAGAVIGGLVAVGAVWDGYETQREEELRVE